MGNILKRKFTTKGFQTLNNDYLQSILGGSRSDYKSGYRWGKVARNALELWALFK